MTNVTTTSFR